MELYGISKDQFFLFNTGLDYQSYNIFGAHKYNYNGKDIPYYKFDKNSEMEHIKLPPMAEGLFNIDNDLYILFENSSDKYFYALPKMKKIIKYHI